MRIVAVCMLLCASLAILPTYGRRSFAQSSRFENATPIPTPLPGWRPPVVGAGPPVADVLPDWWYKLPDTARPPYPGFVAGNRSFIAPNRKCAMLVLWALRNGQDIGTTRKQIESSLPRTAKDCELELGDAYWHKAHDVIPTPLPPEIMSRYTPLPPAAMPTP